MSLLVDANEEPLLTDVNLRPLLVHANGGRFPICDNEGPLHVDAN